MTQILRCPSRKARSFLINTQNDPTLKSSYKYIALKNVHNCKTFKLFNSGFGRFKNDLDNTGIKSCYFIAFDFGKLIHISLNIICVFTVTLCISGSK